MVKTFSFYSKKDAIYCCLLLFGLAVFGWGLIAAWMKPAVSYEASIYYSTPVLYWLALGVSLLIGFYVVIKESFFNSSNKLLLFSGYVLLLTAYASFLGLWIIRGYYLWCSGDPFTHLGWIKDVLVSGHTQRQNFYPITHIYLAQISNIFGIDPILTHKDVPLYFGLLYVLFMCLFARSILPQKGQAIAVFLVSIIPMHDYLNLTPNHLSNLFLPLALFVLMKNIKEAATYQWGILLVLMVMLLPIFHPVPSAAFLIMLVVFVSPLRKKIEEFFSTRFNIERKAVNSRYRWVTPLLFFVWIITWISSFYVWEGTIRNLYVLLTEGGMTHFRELTDKVLYAEMYGYSVFLQFIKVYGGMLIYLILCLIGTIMIWKKMKMDLSVFDKYRFLLYLLLLLFITIFLMVVLYFTNIGFGPERLETYIIIYCTVFVGYVFFELLKNQKLQLSSVNRSFRKDFLVPLMLVGLFAVAALKLYPSPYILSANWHIPKTEIVGMNWVLHKKNENYLITAISISPGRYSEALLSPEERKLIKAPYEIPEELKIPNHFGYDVDENLGMNYKEDLYMVLTYRDQIMYKEIFPEIADLRYVDSDFKKLESDTSVSKLYENGGLSSYYIYAV